MISELPEMTLYVGGVPYECKNAVFRPTDLGAPAASQGTYSNAPYQVSITTEMLEASLEEWKAILDAFPEPSIAMFAKCREIFPCEKLERERGHGWLNVSAAERNADRVKRWRNRNLEVAYVDENKWLWFPEPAWPLLEEAVKRADAEAEIERLKTDT